MPRTSRFPDTILSGSDSDRDLVNDATLATAAAAGDSVAFAQIYDRYADCLRDFCLAMVRDHDTASDCVQDVFCAAATRLHQLRDPEKLRPWLYAIARHEALRQIRRHRRERPSDELPESESAEPGPYALAARSELEDLIDRAAGGLSDRDRLVLEFAYRHGLHGSDLANALGVSDSHAHILTHRMRGNFERCLSAQLLANSAHGADDGCSELQVILQDWDGRLSILLRKRIARHIESCTGCDAKRRRLLNPVALLGGVPLFIPVPERLREPAVQLTSSASAYLAFHTRRIAALFGRSRPSAATTGDAAESRRRYGLLLLLILPLLVIALMIANWPAEHKNAYTPTQFSAVPAHLTTAPSPSTTPPPRPPKTNAPVAAAPLPPRRPIIAAPSRRVVVVTPAPTPVGPAPTRSTIHPPRTTTSPVPVIHVPSSNPTVPRKHRGPKPQDNPSDGGSEPDNPSDPGNPSAGLG